MSSDDRSNDVGQGQVLLSLGKLTGAVEAMHTGLTARIDDIRNDIRRMESAHTQRMDKMEAHFSTRLAETEAAIGKRLDSMGSRVTALEAEDKKLIEKTARLGALGGGLGGALAAGLVEIIKRM